ncbi:MAG TPA: hypothetical protein V6D02_00115 [Candidatus Obscuribacterales bacterium]
MPYRFQRRSIRVPNGGFTLLETLTIVTIVGILAAIAIPTWLKFKANREVTIARDAVRTGIQQAQQAAIANRGIWRFSIRQGADQLEWATHPETVSWQEIQTWNTLSQQVVFHAPDTTFLKKGDAYYVSFGFQGEVRGRLGTVTLDSQNGIAKNKCVVVSTLIGATRKGEEQPYPNGKRYCY